VKAVLVYNAVIVAAGLGKRMRAFKPLIMLPGTGETFISRIIRTFCEAGIHRITIVTGHKADLLEGTLRDSPFAANLGFVRNSRYETSDMFSSVKLGLKAASQDADFVFSTPVDAPLFSGALVEALKKAIAARGSPDALIPFHGGKRGHPVALKAEAARIILRTESDSGLYGALQKLPPERGGEGGAIYFPTDDALCVRDFDTPEDLANLGIRKKINI
jgi:CTP:molybdopterin cytidylyltransferase MocA